MENNNENQNQQFRICNKNNHKRIKNLSNSVELTIEVEPSVLSKTRLSEKGIQNVLTSMYSRLLTDNDIFSIYSVQLKSLILAKKERKIENKTIIKVYDVIDDSFFVNTGIMTFDAKDIDFNPKL